MTETLIRLTRQQRVALEALRDRTSEGLPTTRRMADWMIPGYPGVTYDRVYALLVRLEKRGLAERRRSDGQTYWALTELGQEAIRD